MNRRRDLAERGVHRARVALTEQGDGFLDGTAIIDGRPASRRLLKKGAGSPRKRRVSARGGEFLQFDRDGARRF